MAAPLPSGTYNVLEYSEEVAELICSAASTRSAITLHLVHETSRKSRQIVPIRFMVRTLNLGQTSTLVIGVVDDVENANHGRTLRLNIPIEGMGPTRAALTK